MTGEEVVWDLIDTRAVEVVETWTANEEADHDHLYGVEKGEAVAHVQNTYLTELGSYVHDVKIMRVAAFCSERSTKEMHHGDGIVRSVPDGEARYYVILEKAGGEAKIEIKAPFAHPDYVRRIEVHPTFDPGETRKITHFAPPE